MKCLKCFAFCRRKTNKVSISLNKSSTKEEGVSTTKIGPDVIENIRNRIAKSFERQNFAPPRPLTSNVVVERVLIPVYLESGQKFIDTGRSVEMAFTED